MMAGNDKWLKICIVVFLFLFLAVILAGMPGHPFDMFCFRSWANNIYDHGFTKTYMADENDYLPLYQYILWGYTKLTGSNKLIWERIMYLRLLTIAFEVLGLWYVYKWLKEKTDFILLLLVSILNIGFSYNSIVWGQVDGMLAAMIFISVYYAYRNKAIVSMLWFLLALNLKLQAIIFVPVLGYLYLHSVRTVNFKKLISGIFALAIGQVLLIAPFIQTPESRHNFHEAIFGSVGRYPFISIYAFNFWYWLFPAEGAIKLNDAQIWFPHFTYHRFGLMLFCTMSFVALWPLLKNLYTNFKKKCHTQIEANRLMLVCAIIPILFFFCNTQMHERYPHPAFIFLTAYAFSARDFIPYIIFSLAYFLNLEKELQWLKLTNYDTVIFNPGFIAGMYCLAIVYLFIRIYRPKRRIFSGEQRSIFTR